MLAPVQRQAMPDRTAGGYSIPAPIGGLNARDALANMAETDAIILDNFFPQPSWVEVRGGKKTLATFTGQCETVSAYVGLVVSQLYGAVVNGSTRSIYRVDGLGGGAVGAAVVGGAGNTVQPITSTLYDWAQYGTGSAEVLYLVNGSDQPLLYDGTTWWAVGTVTATITGITQAASAVVTINTVSGTNPYAIGNTIGFQGVGGMTQINGLMGTVTAIGGASGAWTATVNINSSGFSAYTSGGVANPYVLTGVAGVVSSLSCVALYKQRLWFLQKGTFNVYYLAQNTFAGALLQLNMGALFFLGGSLVSIIGISIDNAAGLNDYIAFVSSVGEVVVFQGYDPSSVSTWAQSAHFRIGRPIGTGRRCWQKLGSDAAVITVDGVVLLSDALLTDRSQTRNALSDKIRRAINQNVQIYGNETGWQIQLFPIGNKLIVNVPTTVDTASFQYVMNTLTGAWCTFGQYASAWNALCFETMGDALYYGANGRVCQADTGGDDDGSAIIARAQTAFSYFGQKGALKLWQMCRPVFLLNGSLQLTLSLNVDFNTQLATGTVGISVGNQAIWNVSLWPKPTLWGDPLLIYKNWFGVSGLGYAASLNVQVSALDVTMQWQSTDFIFQGGGLV